MVKGLRTSPTADGVAGALAICLTLLACITAGGKLGGCFNPAVGAVVSTFSQFHLENVNSSLTHYMYAFNIGPFLGGLAAGSFNLLHRQHFEKSATGETEATKAQKAE